MMPLREFAPEAPEAPAAGPPCAFQSCDRRAAAYPVVQLPPPAATASGQPLRVVFRRSPVCDLHRRPMVLHLGAHLREGMGGYFARRALPPPEWDAATWEWQPVEEGR